MNFAVESSETKKTMDSRTKVMPRGMLSKNGPIRWEPSASSADRQGMKPIPWAPKIAIADAPATGVHFGSCGDFSHEHGLAPGDHA